MTFLPQSRGGSWRGLRPQPKDGVRWRCWAREWQSGKPLTFEGGAVLSVEAVPAFLPSLFTTLNSRRIRKAGRQETCRSRVVGNSRRTNESSTFAVQRLRRQSRKRWMPSLRSSTWKLIRSVSSSFLFILCALCGSVVKKLLRPSSQSPKDIAAQSVVAIGEFVV